MDFKTTITQIIKHAETGYGTAYVFQNKDDLLISLMEDVMNRFIISLSALFSTNKRGSTYNDPKSS